MSANSELQRSLKECEASYKVAVPSEESMMCCAGAVMAQGRAALVPSQGARQAACLAGGSLGWVETQLDAPLFVCTEDWKRKIIITVLLWETMLVPAENQSRHGDPT